VATKSKFETFTFVTLAGIVRYWALGGVILCALTVSADQKHAKNPFHYIFERNVFGLRPRPAAPPQGVPRDPPPKVILKGITTILGDKRALLKVQFPRKSLSPAKEESYILTEGQGNGLIKVLAINEKAESVKVDDCGTIIDVTFEPPKPSPPPVANPSPPNRFPLPIKRVWPKQ
jgi:hypothetical protein